MKIGYARISANEPASSVSMTPEEAEEMPDGQVRELQQAGCVKIFTDSLSGTNTLPTAFHRLLDSIVTGDILVVWKLDSLGCSTKHLLELMERLFHQGVHFISLQDTIDTTTPEGKNAYQVFRALAELERSRIRERTEPARRAARARGRQGGRPRGLTPHYQQMAPAIKILYESRQLSTAQIMREFGIGSRRTLYKILRFTGVEIDSFQREPLVSG